jgi:hypothetical protein
MFTRVGIPSGSPPGSTVGERVVIRRAVASHNDDPASLFQG